MKELLLILMLLFGGMSIHAQIINKEVKAIIELKESEDLFEVNAKAENLSNISRSATYELKVFRESLSKGNKSSSKQSGRFVIELKEIKSLSIKSVNVTRDDKIIILLLIRDLEENIIGRARKVIISNVVQEEQFDKKQIVNNKPKDDGVKLRGVVLQQLKTKPGRDFYNYFYSSFLRYNFSDSRPILLEEIHDRGRTTKIFVKIDNKKIYEFFVQPNLDYLKKQSDMSIRSVYQFFEKKEKDYIVRY